MGSSSSKEICKCGQDTMPHKGSTNNIGYRAVFHASLYSGGIARGSPDSVVERPEQGALTVQAD
ncbi:hypothetical protein AG1IA_08176 [Rhizoctonia solani AG-1 IA]|uniref:Uncharacterized protein n=1 Tax=Thanatephorus cucumeris (strain AG1-IA) TaxID=983506 RepID=L8WLW1_THACA|nr:hypothetical protein AG1IA_08176 [Rhizoctonia solani AG-1 IA]